MEIKKCKCCGRELPIEDFVTNFHGVTSVCRECNKKNRSEAALNRKKKLNMEAQIENARKARISEFTPRELMEELKRRGYEGKLTYTETHTIDLSSF